MPDFSKIGRNNKNRGRKFENEVADKLGWTRVPYSGAQGNWGKADVVDGFYVKRGFWAAECKTEVLDGDGPAHLNIKHKWVAQMLGGERGGRQGIIVVRRVRRGARPGTKAPTRYVLMHEDVFDWFRDKIRAAKLEQGYDPIGVVTDLMLVPCARASKTRGRGYNFGIDAADLGQPAVLYGGGPLHVPVLGPDGQTNWMVFTLDAFASLTIEFGIYVPDEVPEDADD